MSQATQWRPVNPMPEGTVFLDGSGEEFDPTKWKRVFYDDEEYLGIVNGMPLTCTDVIWVNPVHKVFYLAWRKVHSAKGPWMFGGRQRRGETPREAARRLLKNEVGADVAENELHFVQWAIALSKYREQQPQDMGAHYVLFHYCYVASDELVAAKQATLTPEEYDLTHGIKPYSRADIEALEPNGYYGFNRAILLQEFDRIFGKE